LAKIWTFLTQNTDIQAEKVILISGFEKIPPFVPKISENRKK
jgi:hypothetical protein